MRAALIGITLALTALFGVTAQAQSSRLTVVGAAAVLTGLDKITGQTSPIEARIGRPVKFGTLEIVAQSCRRSPPEDAPETAVYLEITDFPLRGVDETVDPEPKKVFSGWVFASNPAANALEHPVYDVWAINCKT